MKKEVIIVPKYKCPLDVLADMENRTENAWIFLHSNAIDKLQHSEGVSCKLGRKAGTIDLTWEATEDYPETRIVIDICAMVTEWKPIIFISASDISFNLMPVDPEDLYFLKMEE